MKKITTTIAFFAVTIMFYGQSLGYQDLAKSW